MANAREWKDVVGYEDYYMVSNDGYVFSKRSNRIMNRSLTSMGYYRVIFCIDKIEKAMYIHRLVAMAFIPNPNNYPCVNHKDENPKNNNVENLEWCTHKYNTNYGSCIEKDRIKHINHKSLSKPIVCYKNGVVVKEYPSIREAQRQTGIKNQNITLCCQGKLKRTGGYQWKYKKIV